MSPAPSNAAQAFEAAVAAFSRGDLATARRTGEALLKAHPGNPSLLQLLGVVACAQDDPKRGAKLLREAIARGADTADNHVNLAKAQLAAGDLKGAEATASNPRFKDHPDFGQLRAELLKARGDTGATIDHYRSQTIATPDNFAAWNNLGNALHAAGDFEGALEALGRAVELDPQSPLPRINRARVLSSLDRYEDACMALEQAHLLDPSDPAPLIELGRTLTSIDHAEAGIRALGSAARLDPTNPRVFHAIGLAFTDLGDLAQAERAFRVALQVDPTHAPAYLELGTQLEKSNRLADLDALLADAARNKVSGSEIDYLRALVLNRAGDTAAAYDLAKTVQTAALHPATVAQFVGQLADRLGRTDEAYAAFATMNQAAADSPLGVAVDRSAYQRDLDRLIAYATPEWAGDLANRKPADDGRAPPAFLVGFPRSGTTLLDTFLMGHSGTHVLEEVPILETVAQGIGDPLRIPSLTPGEIAAARDRYYAELDRRQPPPPGKLVIDKNPLSMIRLPLIRALFPDAKVILALRHPADVVLSCFMQNFKVTEAMAGFLDLENAARTYDRVFALWERYAALFPDNIATIKYEDMVADPAGTIAPLVQFLGLPWEGELLDHQRTAQDRGYIRTPSYAQVTEPVYARAAGRWTRYRDQLRYALPTIAPWCERFGYALD